MQRRRICRIFLFALIHFFYFFKINNKIRSKELVKLYTYLHKIPRVYLIILPDKLPGAAALGSVSIVDVRGPRTLYHLELEVPSLDQINGLLFHAQIGP